jgi:hypothetical protein
VTRQPAGSVVPQRRPPQEVVGAEQELVGCDGVVGLVAAL